MNGPYCESTATTNRTDRTAVGYLRFTSRTRGRCFNGRTDTPFNDRQYPTDRTLLAALSRLRYKLTFREVAELLLGLSFGLTHETIQDWEIRFTPPPCRLTARQASWPRRPRRSHLPELGEQPARELRRQWR